jgi:YegS/Rv2252/BmrU family lipid kinase
MIRWRGRRLDAQRRAVFALDRMTSLAGLGLVSARGAQRAQYHGAHVFTGKHILVIINPASGKAKPEVAERTISTALEAVDASFELRTTGAPEDPRAWARAAGGEGFDVVLAAGGDGTVTAVATGLLESDAPVPLGIVPMGTGNGLARVLRLPMDAAKAIEAMHEGHELALDVVKVDSHGSIALFFLGAGLDAEINRDADPAAKKRFGFLAYVGATARNLWGRRNHSVDLTIDDRRETFEAHTVTGFNAGQFELVGFDVGPDVDPHDGYLDITVMRSPGFWTSLAAVLRLASGQREASMNSRRARSFRIDARPPLLVHIDGDVVGSTPVAGAVLPGALRVIAAGDYPSPRRADRTESDEASVPTPDASPG